MIDVLAPIIWVGGMAAIAAGSLWMISRWMPVPPTGIDEARALWDELATVPDHDPDEDGAL